MSFFEDLPAPDEPPQQQRYVEPVWMRIPREYIPTPLPISALIHRSEEAALVVDGVAVYPTGFTFTVAATLHPEVDSAARGPMHEVFHGRSPEYRASAVRIGLLYDDGTRALHAEDGPGMRSRPPVACLSSRGGSASNDTAQADFFAWPIPERGDLTLMFKWAAHDLDEARLVIPGDDLRAAAASATEIWPGARVPEPPADGEGWGCY